MPRTPRGARFFSYFALIAACSSRSTLFCLFCVGCRVFLTEHSFLLILRRLPRVPHGARFSAYFASFAACPTEHAFFISFSVAAAVSVVSVVSARLRPSPPVLACPRLSSPVHHPSSPPPFPSLAFALYPVQPLSSASAFNFSVPPSPVYPCFTPVYSCLFLSVSPSFYAPAFLALSFRPVLLVSGTACSRAFLHFVLFCYPLRASYSGVFFPRPVLHPLRPSFSAVLFLRLFLHPF